MVITQIAVLKWLHIVAMTYWLGGEWGVFQTARHVVNRDLSMEERRRHMETAHRIDILARTGIMFLLPLGLHMGTFWGVQPYKGPWLVAMWIIFIPWISLCWAGFYNRDTPKGFAINKLEEKIRFVLIPSLIIASISSLLGYGPFAGGEMQKWYATKIFLFSLMLIIGLKLRFVMREWGELFIELEKKGSDKEIENRLDRELRLSRKLAYIYWVGILTIAFLGAVKPF